MLQEARRKKGKRKQGGGRYHSYPTIRPVIPKTCPWLRRLAAPDECQPQGSDPSLWKRGIGSPPQCAPTSSSSSSGRGPWTRPEWSKKTLPRDREAQGCSQIIDLQTQGSKLDYQRRIMMSYVREDLRTQNNWNGPNDQEQQTCPLKSCKLSYSWSMSYSPTRSATAIWLSRQVVHRARNSRSSSSL